jgi:putative transposase
MPRSPRLLLPGGYYHLINRGNDRRAVFHTPADYRSFLTLVNAAQDRAPLGLLAFCLMPNHFHLVVTPGHAGDVSRWMHWLMTTHTHRHRLRYETTGAIWQGRFKAFPIEDDAHLHTVLRYVERNALRAGLVDRAERWPWGSLTLRANGAPLPELTAPPIRLPTDWIERVNEAHTPAELEALRTCVNRQRPFGHREWIRDHDPHPRETTPIRRRGRPRKEN